MDDAARVGVVEGLAEGGADLADLVVGELPPAAEAGGGRALDQLGDEERVPFLFANLMGGEDAGGVERGRGRGLARDARAGLPLLLDRFARAGALGAPAPALVDDAETAAADTALDQEA